MLRKPTQMGHSVSSGLVATWAQCPIILFSYILLFLNRNRYMAVPRLIQSVSVSWPTDVELGRSKYEVWSNSLWFMWQKLSIIFLSIFCWYGVYFIGCLLLGSWHWQISGGGIAPVDMYVWYFTCTLVKTQKKSCQLTRHLNALTGDTSSCLTKSSI